MNDVISAQDLVNSECLAAETDVDVDAGNRETRPSTGDSVFCARALEADARIIRDCITMRDCLAVFYLGAGPYHKAEKAGASDDVLQIAFETHIALYNPMMHLGNRIAMTLTGTAEGAAAKRRLVEWYEPQCPKDVCDIVRQIQHSCERDTAWLSEQESRAISQVAPVHRAGSFLNRLNRGEVGGKS